MSDERAWDYCSICGRKIPVGEMCYGVRRNAALLFSGNTICKDCIAPENYEPAPADDVRLVVRGRWIKQDDDLLDGNFYCSACHSRIDIATGLETPIDRGLFFCPNCGADMRGGSEQ